MLLENQYKRFITLFVEVGFIVPVVAVSKMIIAMNLLDIPFNSMAVLLIALISLSVYLFDRLMVDGEDVNSKLKRNRVNLINKYYYVLLFISISSLLCYLLISYYSLTITQFILINIPIYIFAIYETLKHTLFLDTVGIALAWSSQLILLPLFFSDINISYIMLFVTFIVFSIMKMSESELSNIRDIKADSDVGNETLPVKFGPKLMNNITIFGEFISILIIVIFINNIIFTGVAILLYVLLFIKTYNIDSTLVSEIMLQNRLTKIVLGFILLVV